MSIISASDAASAVAAVQQGTVSSTADDDDEDEETPLNVSTTSEALPSRARHPLDRGSMSHLTPESVTEDADATYAFLSGVLGRFGIGAPRR